ncbi:pre-16S rRNA-processing nuclease YqgF [Candidatus Daviesbacteria bacterium]|nr:pre-16S rRNA-processing nuclease YqgF [Candidatus Daviesbacteria bacterium]
MKYLGVDFGLKKIGLAVSEGEFASPWQIVKVKNIPDAVGKIGSIIEKGSFPKVIVGLPEGKMEKNVIGFVKALKKRGFEVETAPETLSSKRALKSMIEQGVRQKKRREEDAYSAAEILQQFLDNQ